MQDAGEPVLVNVTLELLDANGDPVYVDPVTGGVVTSTTVGAIPYQVNTDANGLYLFSNLPRANYSVRVIDSTLPPGLIQTFDNSDALDNTSTKTLTRITDALGVITGVENNVAQDFGYRPAVVDVSLQKTTNPSSALRGATVIYTLTVRNDGADAANGIAVADALPVGVTYSGHSAGEIYTGGVWNVGSLASGEVKTLDITVTVD